MFCKLIEKVTGVKRYQPKIEWSSKSWTHNFFRLSTLLFGEVYGVKPYSSVNAIIKDGKIDSVEYTLYTKEAVVAFYEGQIRAYLSNIAQDIKNVFAPVFATQFVRVVPANGVMPKGYLFAVAFDTSLASTTPYTNFGTSYSMNYTCTGSNLVLVNAVYDTDHNNSDVVTANTYNSVSLTKKQQAARGGDSGQTMTSWYLANPSTGSNSMAITLSSAITAGVLIGLSYTGATIPDASAAVSQTSGTPFTFSVTTVTDNSWIMAWIAGTTGATMSAGTGTTFRAGATNTCQSMDSNGAKTPTGSYSLQVTGDNNYFGIIMTIPPYSAPVNTTNFFMMM